MTEFFCKDCAGIMDLIGRAKDKYGLALDIWQCQNCGRMVEEKVAPDRGQWK